MYMLDVVITTVFPPTSAMRILSEGLAARGGRLWVIGDRKGPPAYELPATCFCSIGKQMELPFELGRMLPERHYARKNLGYLLAIQQGAQTITETDDDNAPTSAFWEPRQAQLRARSAVRPGWWNVYRDFSAARIWPRGFPLAQLNASFAEPPATHALVDAECLIQQGLADDNPDVDALYRLTAELPVRFDATSAPVALGRGCWCPFNSQNTTFFPPAWPLLYLPSHCSFRMTDIWRSFVAQRCLWEMKSRLSFAGPSMRQDRNEHDLLRDFEQEIPGYLHNDRIRQLLDGLVLEPGRSRAAVAGNLTACYAAMVKAGFLPEAELSLVAAWNRDLALALARLPVHPVGHAAGQLPQFRPEL